MTSANLIKVVAIGGGTGLSTLLRGLKQYVRISGSDLPHGEDRSDKHKVVISDLAAVVTVTDDGGSSGRLRKDFNILPPGDIRNCLVALSEDERMLSKLFQYRFSSGVGLEGHNFGNLFLAALTAVTGDFSQAVEESSVILATRGHIYPATKSNVQLEALMDDDSHVLGETNITASKRRIVELFMVPTDARPLPQTLAAIESADLITIGPGSLFTSLIPNLLVQGIPRAIASSKAVKAYVCNLMTQANESLGLTAADHIKAIYDHAKDHFFDYALINSAPISREILERYACEGAEPIVVDEENIERMGVRGILGNYLSEGTLVRHNATRIAEDLLKLVAARS